MDFDEFRDLSGSRCGFISVTSISVYTRLNIQEPVFIVHHVFIAENRIDIYAIDFAKFLAEALEGVKHAIITE